MVALAMLLILGLLPAVLAVQAASTLADYMTSRRLGARDDRRRSTAMVERRPAGWLVSSSSGHRTPSLGGDGVLSMSGMAS